MPEPLAMTVRQGKASAGSLLSEWTDSLHALYSSRDAAVYLSHRIGIHRRRSAIDGKHGIRKRLIRRWREALPV